MEKKEKVVCAAIHYQDNKTYPHQPINISSGLVISGLRHNNCIATRSAIGITKLCPKIEGFITTHNQFLNREKAYIVALEAKQIIRGKTCFLDKLDSSDLY